VDTAIVRQRGSNLPRDCKSLPASSMPYPPLDFQAILYPIKPVTGYGCQGPKKQARSVTAGSKVVVCLE